MKLAYGAMAALVIAGSVGVAAQAGPRRDGNWEVTIEMGMPDMPNMPPGMTMPPMKTTQCITKADAEDPQKAIPSRGPRGGPQNDCKIDNYHATGNKVTYDMVCTGAQPMTGHSEFTYTGDSYTGIMTMNGARGGQPMAMTMKYNGKRLGDCAK